MWNIPAFLGRAQNELVPRETTLCHCLWCSREDIPRRNTLVPRPRECSTWNGLSRRVELPKCQIWFAQLTSLQRTFVQRKNLLSDEDCRKPDLIRRRTGPCSTWNETRRIAHNPSKAKKPCVIRSMRRRLGAFLCPRGGGGAVNWGLGGVRPSPKCGFSGFPGGRELRSRE